MEKFTLKILDFLLAFSITFVTATFGLIGYLFVNYDKLSSAKILAVSSAMVVCATISLILIIAYLINLNKLKGEQNG